MSAPSSPASAEWTTDSPELGFDTPSSVSQILGGEKSSPITSPESRSTRTYALSENQRGELLLTDVAHQLTSGGGKPGQGYPAVLTYAMSPEAERSGEALTPSADAEGRVRLRPPSFGLYVEESPTLQSGRPPSICSVADSPAKTSALPGNEPDSQATDPASSTSSPESLSLFDPDGFSSRTYPVSSLAMAVGTSEQSLERWPTSGTAWPGGFSTHATSECRSDEGGCSSSEPSLTEILEPPQNVAAKYSLSARAASGILRRAQKRGRTLPQHLADALQAVSTTKGADS